MSFTMRTPEETPVGVTYVGPDVHRKSLAAMILDDGGRLVHPTKFGPSSPREFTQVPCRTSERLS